MLLSSIGANLAVELERTRKQIAAISQKGDALMPKKGTKVGVWPLGPDIPVVPLEGDTIDILKGRKQPPHPIPLFPESKKK